MHIHDPKTHFPVSLPIAKKHFQRAYSCERAYFFLKTNIFGGLAKMSFAPMCVAKISFANDVRHTL